MEREGRRTFVEILGVLTYRFRGLLVAGGKLCFCLGEALCGLFENRVLCRVACGNQRDSNVSFRYLKSA